jgi:hypothetical protein
MRAVFVYVYLYFFGVCMYVCESWNVHFMQVRIVHPPIQISMHTHLHGCTNTHRHHARPTLSVCMCVFVNILMCVCVYMLIFMDVCVYSCIYVCVFVNIYMYVRYQAPYKTKNQLSPN